jgi:transcriptional regulator with XRE-family HTH domain
MQKHGRERPVAITPELAFAKALQEIRKRRKVSQEELGFESGYHRTYISLLERGKMNPSLRTLLSLGAALDTPAAELVARVESLLGGKWRRARIE